MRVSSTSNICARSWLQNQKSKMPSEPCPSIHICPATNTTHTCTQIPWLSGSAFTPHQAGTSSHLKTHMRTHAYTHSHTHSLSLLVLYMHALHAYVPLTEQHFCWIIIQCNSQAHSKRVVVANITRLIIDGTKHAGTDTHCFWVCFLHCDTIALCAIHCRFTLTLFPRKLPNRRKWFLGQ